MNKLMKVCFMLMAVGAVLVLVGVLAGGKLAFSYSLGGRVRTEQAEEYKMLTEEIKPFTNIQMEVADFNIEVVVGDGYTVTYPEETSDMDTKVSVQGDTLKLTQKYKKQFHVFNFDILSIGPFEWWSSDKTNDVEQKKIIVTVPESPALETIEVKQDMGSLTLESLSAEDIKLDMDYGSLTVQEVKAGSITLKNDYGSMLAKNVEFDKIELSLSYGNVDIIDGSLGEAFCSLACGDISFHEVNGAKAEIKMDYGSLKADTVQFESLQAELSNGAMALKQYAGKQVDLEMEYGSLKAEEIDVSIFVAALDNGDADLVFVGDPDAYALDLRSEQKVLVEGKKQGSKYYSKESGSAKTVSIDADYGNISVDFSR